jgi:chromatin assembly factor 1 subunit A
MLINVLTDTPYGIDPFTFVSTAVQDMKAAKQQVDSAGSEFAVPVLPDHVHDSSAPPVLGSTSGDTSVDMSSLHPNAALSTGAKRAPLKPKSAFPEALVPALLAKIDALNTGSIILIVESAYQDMKAQKGVKKNSLEAKIREVSEKSQKVWTVKPDMRVSSQSCP